MKKLLLLLLAFSFPAVAMQQPKRKHEDREKPQVFYLEINTNDVIFNIYASIAKKQVGYCKFHYNLDKPDQGYIETLYVDSQYRDLGIGYKLFKKAVKSLFKKGYLVIGWDAQQTGDIPIQILDNIYLSMVMKLMHKYELDFFMEERVKNTTPMRIVLKQRQ